MKKIHGKMLATVASLGNSSNSAIFKHKAWVAVFDKA